MLLCAPAARHAHTTSFLITGRGRGSSIGISGGESTGRGIGISGGGRISIVSTKLLKENGVLYRQLQCECCGFECKADRMAMDGEWTGAKSEDAVNQLLRAKSLPDNLGMLGCLENVRPSPLQK